MEEVKKIVVIGGESTGKSTLCEQLSLHFKTNWAKEYAREYLENLNRKYVQPDLYEIAKGQILLQNSLIPTSNQILFCDTDLYVIKIWSEHKYNSCDVKILNLIAQQEYDAYIITSPDMPWVEDPLRENPNQADRDYFFNLYKETIISTQKPFCIVSGDENDRLQSAIEFIQIEFHKLS